MRSGLNQYPPMTGIPVLRERIAAKIEALYGHRYDPVSEITVTAGATQAIITAVLAFVGPGDEVIVLDPCYDSYAPNDRARRRRARSTCRCGPQTFAPDFDRIAAALGAKTQRDHRQLAAQPERHGLVGRRHGAAGRAAAADRRRRHQRRGLRAHGLRRRATRARRASPSSPRARVVVSSFGKTYHVHRLEGRLLQSRRRRSVAEFRKVHQFNVFTVNTPMQHGLASYLADPRTISACRRSTAPSATGSAPGWRRRGCASCRARARTSSASTTRRSATSATTRSAAG